MTELLLEDKLGPTSIGKDAGLSNLVEGGIYTSVAVGTGLAGSYGVTQAADLLASNMAGYGGYLLSNPLIPFFSFATGVGHALGEPGSKEKLITGAGLGLTTLYSLQQTVNTSYGMALPYSLIQFGAGNLSLGGMALIQAAVPVLFLFGIGYLVGKLARLITKREKKVTKRVRA